MRESFKGVNTDNFETVEKVQERNKINDLNREEEDKQGKHKRRQERREAVHNFIIQLMQLTPVGVVVIMFLPILLFKGEVWYISLANVFYGLLASLIASYISTIFKPKKQTKK